MTYKKYIIVAFIFLALSVFIVPGKAFAKAGMTIIPATGTYEVGELFSVIINTDTNNKAINAATGQLNFDSARLEVVSLGTSQSIFTLWTEEPASSNTSGTIRFSGGIPSPGYTGSEGTVVRITFKAKATGRAAVSFVSGSLLANDGNGTNILEELAGATYVINPATKTISNNPSAATSTVKVQSSLATPILTSWPEQVEDHSIVKIQGLGYPKGDVVVYFQVGTNEPYTEYVVAGPDGRFILIHELEKPGLYRVWARNVSPEGEISNASDSVTIEVLPALFLRIGSIAVNYVTVLMIAGGLILLLLLSLFILWSIVRKRHIRHGKEVSEAERALHENFDQLRSGLRQYARHLLKGSSKSNTPNDIDQAERVIEDELNEVEKKIRKEIEDIK